MAWLIGSAANASEGKMIRSPNGNAMFPNGAFYVLQTPLTAQTTNTVSTLFTNDTTMSSTTGLYPTVNLGLPPMAQYPGSTRILPPGSLTPGTLIRGEFDMVCTTTANNLTLTLGLNGPDPATTHNIVTTTGVTAMSAFSAGSYGRLAFMFSVTSVGTSGSISGALQFTYGTGTIITAPIVALTLDTTKQYTIDVKATWSGGSNSLQLAYGAIELIG